jgi:DNA mismatch endonuclease (patch repair protein)
MAYRPPPSSPQVSAHLSQVRRRDTAPEMRVRSLLHQRGLRFRVDQPIAGLPRRRVDIVFPRARVAVFVDGCFWHGCADHCVAPKANAAWWSEKIAANRRRDQETNVALEDLGWTVIRVWEHERPSDAAQEIQTIVTERAGARR